MSTAYFFWTTLYKFTVIITVSVVLYVLGLLCVIFHDGVWLSRNKKNYLPTYLLIYLPTYNALLQSAAMQHRLVYVTVY